MFNGIIMTAEERSAVARWMSISPFRDEERDNNDDDDDSN